MIARLLHYAAAVALGVGGAVAVHELGPGWLAALAEAGYVLERPVFVAVLLAIPALVAIRAHTLSDLPRVQQGLSLLVKSAFVVAVAAALVNPQAVDEEPRKSATVYVVDVSDSIPDAVLAKAHEAVEATWRGKGDNVVRLVVFARDAREVPLPEPLGTGEGADAAEGEEAAAVAPEGEARAKSLPPIPRMAALMEAGADSAEVAASGQGSDVQQALRLAVTLLPDGYLPRVVLVTDGLETRGSLASEVEAARRFGVPIHYRDYTDVPRPAELMVVGLEVPDDIKPNVPFTVKGKVEATADMAASCDLLIDGVVAETVMHQAPRGASEVEIETRVSDGGDKRIALDCHAADAANDRFASNNRFELPVKVPEKPRILYVEGERQYTKNLAAALDKDFDVEYRGARGVPSSLADAQKFDLIFISDVPRAGDMGYQNVTTGQMQVLERYARAGGGLIFAGGEASFGPGGYGDTYLERKVLPVRLDVQRKEDMPGVALMLVIDRSGSMTGPKIELAKQAAIATLDVLQPSDKLGIVAFDSKAELLVHMLRASNRFTIVDNVSRLRPGGGTNIFAALDRAYAELVRTQAKVKHIILLTDGQSNQNGILELVAGSDDDKITISTVAVGMGSDQDLLRRVAVAGRGRYYFTNSPENIPKLFLKETTEVSRRALVEHAFSPRVDRRYRTLQMFKGIDTGRLPVLVGYVSTTAKPRAEVIMRSDLGEPVLARWRLGLGTVMVWTSDVKNKWAHFWLRWPGYAKLWRQIIRDTMRVEKEDPSYQMVADVADGVLTVGVDAVDEEDHFIDGLVSDVKVLAPDGSERPVALTQTAAGRYEGRLALTQYGPYEIEGTHRPVTTAGGDDEDAEGPVFKSFATVAWPFPAEYLAGEPDLSRVSELARATGGALNPTDAQLFDVGDAKTETRTPLWPYPLYAALGLLLLDVLLRRVRFYGKTRLAWRDVRGV
ncbi:MAG: VWA domain-containing protein [Deltaproteobacteria bacterium]|nr:MAG: VWA domain-containing protein [Deltaproteobacteria bacterium]